MPISPDYRKAMGIAVVIQLCILLVSGFTLDGGVSGQLCAMALAPFWAATCLLIWRRPRQPTRFDLGFIRIGYLPVLLVTGYLAGFIWHLRGVM